MTSMHEKRFSLVFIYLMIFYVYENETYRAAGGITLYDEKARRKNRSKSIV